MRRLLARPRAFALKSIIHKGADYKKEEVIGWDIVEKHGGRIALAPLIDGRSTSSLIQKITEAYGPAPR